ncbi:uncharacterized protein H6S33_002862 [Morchella sextelata]|uniref:uncharacterized protein n=1 Tax=Morchella sextelata TaxID=1174677 RepID=UPI001D055C94|nr:uncharacterized protein H6S33_002862 [Morchella sextelata]KAH0607828.1 hypothetical protein H6S33_002862 [Morchella sextelata]
MIQPQTDSVENTAAITSSSARPRRVHKPRNILPGKTPIAPDTSDSASSETETEMASVFVESVPARSFSGRPGERVEAFIESVILNFEPKERLYAPERRDAARVAILCANLRGKAAKWLERQNEEVASSWGELTEALKKRFNNKGKKDERQRRAENAVTNLKQGKLTLKQYIRKAEKVNMDLPVASDLHRTAGRRFYVGLSREQTRCNFLSLGKIDVDDDYTLSQAIEAAKKVLATGTRELSRRWSGSESSDEEVNTSDSEDDSDSYESSEKETKESRRKRNGDSKTRVALEKERKVNKVLIEEKRAQEIFEKERKEKKAALTGEVADLRRLVERLSTQQYNNPFDVTPANRETEVFAVNRGYYNHPRQPSNNQAPGMGGPQYPGGYGNSNQLSAFNQSQAPSPHAIASMGSSQYPSHRQQSYPATGYMPRRHTIQNDARPIVMCFRCGQTGHYSPECVNPPLSIMEQQEVRRRVGEDQIEKIRLQLGLQRQAPLGQYTHTQGQGQASQGHINVPQGLPPNQIAGGHYTAAQGANLVPLGTRPGGTPGGEVRALVQANAAQAGVNAVEICAGDREVGGIRVPEASLVEWFDADAVGKRDSEEAFGRWSSRAGGPTRKKTAQVEDEDEEMGGVATDKGKAKAYQAPGASSRQAPKTVEPRRPIRMMKGIIPENVVQRLRDTKVEGLTWGALFDIAPAARRDVAKGLVQERVPRAPREKATPAAQQEEVHTVEAVNRAREDEGPVVNFYTDGKVRAPGIAGFFTVKRILVDAGSSANPQPPPDALDARGAQGAR